MEQSPLKSEISLNHGEGGGLFSTSIFDDITIVKNCKGVPSYLSLLKLRRTKSKENMPFLGGGVPDGKLKKLNIFGLFRGGCSEDGAVPVDSYCINIIDPICCSSYLCHNSKFTK